jgi:hypothetical protein
VNAKIAVLEMIAGAGLTFLVTLALAWHSRRRSKSKSPKYRLNVKRSQSRLCEMRESLRP